MRFAGKVAVVTGASRGIGRAIAVALAREGARVAVHYNERSDAAAETLALLDGSGHMTVRAGMDDPAAIREAIDSVAGEMGGIDVLVNNAAIYVPHAIADVSYEDWQSAWRRTIEVNLLGAANATWCAARHMISAGRGSIVFVSSRGAFRGEPEFPAYGASKGGMNSFAGSMAVALGPHGITVTTVAPGFVETDMAAEFLNGPRGEAIKAQSPLARAATPEEVASVVAFLASGEAPYASGAIVDVNGASYLRS